MTERSKKSKTQYTDEFKADAVRLVSDEQLSVAQVARDLGMPANTLYSWVKKARSHAALLEHIRRVFDASKGRYGARRVLERALELEGHRAGKHRVARLMRENGSFARRRKAFRATTDSKHAYPVADNVLDREFEADAPDQAWVGAPQGHSVALLPAHQLHPDRCRLAVPGGAHRPVLETCYWLGDEQSHRPETDAHRAWHGAGSAAAGQGLHSPHRPRLTVCSPRVSR